MTTADPIHYPDDLTVLDLVVEQRYEHAFAADAWHIPLAGLDAEKNLYVLDWLASAVVALTPAGTSWTIGSEGDGPGELRGATAAAVSGDTLYVLSQTRISEFLLDGTPVRADLFLNPGLWSPRSVAVLEGGLLIYARGRRFAFGLLRHDRDSGSLETLFTAFPPELHQEKDEASPHALIGLAEPSISLSPSGVAYVSTGSPYEISVLSASGEVIEMRGTNPPPVQVDATDQQAYEWLIIAAGNEGTGRNRKAAAWRGFVESTVPDADGNLLVERRDLLGDGTSTWDYLTPDWRVAGRFTIPWNLSIKLLDRCHVYGVEVDETGVGTVIRYQLEPCPS